MSRKGVLREMVAKGLKVHAVRNIVTENTKSIQMTAIEFEDGRKLAGIVDAQMRLAPGGKRVYLNILVAGEFTINGAPAVDTFEAALAGKPVVEVPDAPAIVGPDGRPLS